MKIRPPKNIPLNEIIPLEPTLLMGAGPVPVPKEVAMANSIVISHLGDSMKQIVYHDGSDDSLEMQVSQIAKNQSMHTMAIAMMKTQFRQLQMAITGSANV